MAIRKKNEISDRNDMKICPYCANEIKVGAKKCKYCKESLIEEKEFNNEVLEVEQGNNKTKRIWGRILALSIPIVSITWLIISIIFYIIGVSTGGESELMFVIKKSINWILGILCFLSFFFTIRGIIILCKSDSKSDGVLHDGDEIDSKNVKSSIKISNIVKWFMCGYIIWVVIDFLLVFTLNNLSEWIEVLLNSVFIVGALISQIVWRFKTYRGLQKAKIGGLTFPTGWGRLAFGWICPIANLFMPYQIVRDIMNAYKLKTGKTIITSFFGTVVGRRWFVDLLNGFIGVILRGTEEGSITSVVLPILFRIIGYILFIEIIIRIQKMQKKYLVGK